MLIQALLTFVVSTAGATDLDTKLEAQWGRYEIARENLLSRLSNSGPAIERQEWERLLTPPEELRLNAGDLSELSIRQATRAEEARRRAIRESVIDIDQFRSRPDRVAQFCSAIPKGGMLHVHPYGTANRETVRRLLEASPEPLPFQAMVDTIREPARGMLLYPDEITWLESLGSPVPYSGLPAFHQARYLGFLFLPPGNHPFERFESVFLFLGTAIPDWAAYEQVFMDFARRAAAQHVSYVEFTEGVTTRSLPTYDRVFTRIERETGVVVRANRSFARTKSAEALAADLADLFQTPLNKWVVGIDLLANENGHPALEKAQLVYGSVLLAVNNGQSQLHRTMHSGEIGDERNPRDAMILGAERLGHAVKLAGDPVALEYAARNRIAVEANLTSNLRLTHIRNLATHPYLHYLRLGIPVSLSTDDEGIFDTDINHECELAVSQTDVTYSELKEMALNGIETSFATIEDKAVLRVRVQRAFARFEEEFQR